MNGTQEHPAVFTSLYDDTYGGDTNSDVDATTPSPGDWCGIYLNGQDDNEGIGEFDWCIIRYGGKACEADANVRFHYSDSGYFHNSRSEYSERQGVWVDNCSLTFRRNWIRDNISSTLSE